MGKIKNLRAFKSVIKEFKPDLIICNIHSKIFKKIYAKHKTIKIIHGNYENYYNLDLEPYCTIVLLASKDRVKFEAKYPKKQFYLIPNFLPQIPINSSDYEQKTILSVGRVSSEKGFERLIEIYDLIQKDAKYKEWKLHIVGEGELKTQIQEKIKQKDLQDKIILKPFTKEIEKEYLSASIYAMTSHFEGLPMVLLEASSYALPCIAFDVHTGPSDVIEDNKSGFLIEDNNLEAYASKLRLLMDDENLRKEMGANAKEKMKEKFSKEIILKQWEELFRILNSKE